MNVNATGASSAQSQQRDQAQAQDIMGKDDFLRLLTVQLRYQDPTDPIKDQDFIAQLAQFSALEQTQNLADQMATFIDMQMSYGLTAQSAALLGRTVEIAGDGDETLQGTVEAIRLQGGRPEVVVDGESYPLSNIISVH